MNAKMWTKGCAVLLLGAGMLTTPALGANQVRLGLVNGTDGARTNPEQVKRMMKNNGSEGAVRLTGSLRYSPGHGLQLGQKTVHLRPSTTVYPSPQSRSPEGRDLHGKPVTLFGKQRPDGSIDAYIMILDQGDRFGVQLTPEKMPEIPGFKASEANPLVGEIDGDVGG